MNLLVDPLLKGGTTTSAHRLVRLANCSLRVARIRRHKDLLPNSCLKISRRLRSGPPLSVRYFRDRSNDLPRYFANPTQWRINLALLAGWMDEPAAGDIGTGVEARASSAEDTAESMIADSPNLPSYESVQTPLPRLQRSFALPVFRSELTNPWANDLCIGGIAELNDVNQGSSQEGNLRSLSQTAV
jgi:hypothetical protein